MGGTGRAMGGAHGESLSGWRARSLRPRHRLAGRFRPTPHFRWGRQGQGEGLEAVQPVDGRTEFEAQVLTRASSRSAARSTAAVAFPAPTVALGKHLEQTLLGLEKTMNQPAGACWKFANV